MIRPLHLGFWIAEGIISKNCSLTVTLKSQNTSCEVKKTKTVQNVIVYGKHARSQIKSCRTLNSTLPFTALHYSKDVTAHSLDSAD